MNTVSYTTARLPSVVRRGLDVPPRNSLATRWPSRPETLPENLTPTLAAASLRSPIKVLIAEDRAGVGADLAGWLNRDNITVVGAAPHFAQVTELAIQFQPDVIIISFSMALKTGLQAIGRTLGQLCGARVLVLTPHSDNAFGEHIAATGAAGYLSEQACSTSLASAVRDVHEKSVSFPFGFVRHAHVEHQPQPRAGHTTPDKNSTELTAREREVLQHIAEGNANKQTASKLGISIKTVEKHRQRLMDKLHIHETATLTRYALYAGIAR